MTPSCSRPRYSTALGVSRVSMLRSFTASLLRRRSIAVSAARAASAWGLRSLGHGHPPPPWPRHPPPAIGNGGQKYAASKIPRTCRIEGCSHKFFRFEIPKSFTPSSRTRPQPKAHASPMRGIRLPSRNVPGESSVRSALLVSCSGVNSNAQPASPRSTSR